MTSALWKKKSLNEEVPRDDETRDDREEVDRYEEQNYSLRKVDLAKRASHIKMKNAKTRSPITR